jgi:DNA-directed RNA polymerase specialized sigma24 family protein
MEPMRGPATEESVEARFGRFYDEHRAWAIRLIWLLTHDATDAEDAVQDAFTRVFARFEQLERPAAYLRTVLVRRVYERSRAKRREDLRLTLVHAGTVTSIDGPTGGLVDAIAHLTLQQRTAVVLRYWGGLDDADIASTMGIRGGTVRSLLSRATSQLRKEITR